MSADLIERLEAASEGSRELDALIGLEMNWRVEGDDLSVRIAVERSGLEAFVERAGRHTNVWSSVLPCWSSSLDAALALAERVLPDVEWELSRFDSGCVAKLGDPLLAMEGEAATPALALCAAVLRASQK